MSPHDERVLDVTQDIHDKLDSIRGRTLEVRAGYGGEAMFYTGELLKAPWLTGNQFTEILNVEARIFVECLGLNADRAAKMIERRVEQRDELEVKLNGQ